MYVHCLTHVHFEMPGMFEEYYKRKGWALEIIKLYETEALPSLDDVKHILVMGGPMGVYDEDSFGFLRKEKEFLREAIERNKTIIGVCLGAQLIASVLGAKVYKAKVKEIGFSPVYLTNFAKGLWPTLEEEILCFQWHGDTFDIPKGAKRLFWAEQVENQGFGFSNVLALQFHLEVNRALVENLINNSGCDLTEKAPTIQSMQEMLNFSDYPKLFKVLAEILDTFYSPKWKDAFGERRL